jgi:hypothetical protein
VRETREQLNEYEKGAGSARIASDDRGEAREGTETRLAASGVQEGVKWPW